MDRDVERTEADTRNRNPHEGEDLRTNPCTNPSIKPCRNASRKPCTRPELALPAGSLQCALYAFKGGADAVYLGLKDFSARKGAVNFTFEDARKLKQLCASQNKKFYVTLNTLIADNELPKAESLLRQLEYLEPDGVIVQDIGVARLMRTKFPTIPLHGSTQLAVHTIQGVKALQSMGFSRVVLSRELSFKEIERIRRACPDVELKVFVHGALCYGFSGLCMASECITGRSANRGECAQICRTWFSRSEGGKERQSWPFSMKDLCLGSLVNEYARIGIDSLKVEGRMKGPEYVYWCARYYSLLLDGGNEADIEVKNARQAMQTAFSRETTTGFFDIPTKESLTCTDHPSHRGIRVGSIERVMNGKAVVRFEEPVAIRDGLLVMNQGEKGMESAGFALTRIEGGRSFIGAGESATIDFPSQAFSKRPGFGTTVWCTSRHNQNLPLLSESIPAYKQPVDITIRLLPSTVEVNGIAYQTEPLQAAQRPADIQRQLQDVFKASDKSLFTLGGLTVENESGVESPFLPISLLKRIRRSFYETLDDRFVKSLEEDAPPAVTSHTKASHGMPAPHDTKTAPSEAAKTDGARTTPDGGLPKRSLLGLWDEIKTVDGRKYLPLSPLMFDEAGYMERLDALVADAVSIKGEGHAEEPCEAKSYKAEPCETEPFKTKPQGTETPVIVGLNNIAQVEWAKRHPQVKVFADFFLYTYNGPAYEELKEVLPNLIGSYETRKDTRYTYVGDDFDIPLFTSRVCLRHNSLGPFDNGLPCAGCTKDNTYRMTQNGRRYRVRCKDCITVVTQDE